MTILDRWSPRAPRLSHRRTPRRHAVLGLAHHLHRLRAVQRRQHRQRPHRVRPTIVDATLGPPLVFLAELLPGQITADVRAIAHRLAGSLGAVALRIEGQACATPGSSAWPRTRSSATSPEPTQ